MDKAHPHFPNPAILAVPNYFLTWILTRIHPLFSRSVEEDYTINLVIGGILNTAETDCGLTGPPVAPNRHLSRVLPEKRLQSSPKPITEITFRGEIF